MTERDHFDDLFRRYREPMQLIAFGIVRSRETAAEVVQDVFLKLWSARDTLDVQADYRHYLSRATRNRALDCAAREAMHRRWEESTHDADDLPHGRVPAFAVDDAMIEDESRRALHLAVIDALTAMPERRRQVCQLRWQENLRPTAIATRLSISIKTVETQIARGLADLRERLNRQPNARTHYRK